MNDSEIILSITLTENHSLYFDIMEDCGYGEAEIIHGFQIENHELPAVTLTMMELHLQELDR